MKPQEKDSKGSSFNHHSYLSIELVASVLIGALGGYGLDRRLGTTPWLFLVGLIVGSAAAILNIMRLIPSEDEDIEKKREEGG